MARPEDKKKPIKEKILNCAMKLLCEKGLKKLAQPQIAKEAKVPQGHITYYFPTRSDLLMAVAERSMELVAKRVLQQIAKHKGPLKPESVVPVVADVLKDRPRTRMLVGLLVESDENEKLRDKLRENLNLSLALTATVLDREKIDADVTLVHSALLGLAIHEYLMDKESSAVSMDESLKRLSNMIKGSGQ